MNFTEWRLKHQEFVIVSSVNVDDSRRADVAAAMKLSPARDNECFQNAQRLCAALPHLNYVLGRITVPGFGTIDHAWNSDEHGHFDVTLASRKDFASITYQALVTLTGDQVNEMTWMGMPPTIYEVFMAFQSGTLAAA